MNYRGTTGDDILDQATLGLTDWPTIYGDSGNDRITIGAGIASGERGNDTIIGTSPLSTVAFWSPGGVVVDLAKGTAHDGYGTTDALVNIHTVHGTDFDDRYVGSAENETLWGLGGSDTFVGGGGSDTVGFWNTKTSEVQVSYEQSTDTFTERKHPPEETMAQIYTPELERSVFFPTALRRRISRSTILAILDQWRLRPQMKNSSLATTLFLITTGEHLPTC